MVAIQARFRKDDRPNDGLQEISQELIKKPYERRIVIGLVRPVRSIHNYEDGTQTPTIKFEHIEAIVDEEAVKEAWQLLAERYEERTGNPMPPLTFFDKVGPDTDTDGPDQPLPGLE